MATKKNAGATHQWRFFRAGGFDQVRLDRGADLAHLDQLDQKLWVTLACPTKGLEFDNKTLELLDTDKDGRIRAPELLAALRWTLGLVKNADDLTKEASSLPLAAINDATPEGQQLLVSARHILEILGKQEAQTIAPTDTTDTFKLFAQTKFNGDGVITVASAEDPATKALIQDIIGCLGPETDRSGQPGLNQAKADQFFAEAEAYSAWMKQAEAEADKTMPLGADTANAAALLSRLQAKVADYFTRGRLAAFDPKTIAALNREEKDYLALASCDLTRDSEKLASLPLARIESDCPLPLQVGINPAWEDALELFRAAVVKPLLGDKTMLTEAEWQTLLKRFAPYNTWIAAKAGVAVEKLGLKRLREILASKGRETLTALIAKDKALEPQFNAIATVEKLTRFYCHLHRLCLNFVNFKDFYAREGWAAFQAGTLYLDQRTCRLCLPVEDPGKHAALAGLAGTYLAYCDCVRKGSGEKMQIVAAFTNGDSDYLMVGRNGLFYDRKGHDWDATITKIVENPISLRQAFWLPYKKFVRMIEEMIAKRAATAEAQSTTRMQSAATAVASADKTVAAPAGPAPKKVDVGTVAALGVAFGAIGTFLAAIWANLMGIVALGPLALVGALIGVILLISCPSMLIAWLKLRKRNLGPILDANGWAVNARVRLNTPFGASLTTLPELPPGSRREGKDPYAEKRSWWPKLIVLALLLWITYVVLNNMGYIYDWTDGRLGEKKQTLKVEKEDAALNAKSIGITNLPIDKQ